MRITYDPEADAVYIRFKDATCTTDHWAEGVAADFDSQRHLVGIEILDASKTFADLKVLERLDFEKFAVTSTNRQD
jgi:uncharacterized protein YuzE